MPHIDAILSSIEATEALLAREDNRTRRLELLGELTVLHADLRTQLAIERCVSTPFPVLRVERITS